MEGVNQFFTVQVFKELKIDPSEYAEAYPKELDLVTKLVEHYGIRRFYQAHFKGEVKPLLDAFMVNWAKELGWSEKRKYETPKAMFEYLIDRLKNPVVDEKTKKRKYYPIPNCKVLLDRLAPKARKVSKLRRTTARLAKLEGPALPRFKCLRTH